MVSGRSPGELSKEVILRQDSQARIRKDHAFSKISPNDFKVRSRDSLIGICVGENARGDALDCPIRPGEIQGCRTFFSLPIRCSLWCQGIWNLIVSQCFSKTLDFPKT